MRVAVIGTGYVGLVAGTCLADTGNDVTCVDIDREKVARLTRGEIPIYEPGLAELVTKNVAGKRLTFTTDLVSAATAADVIFIAVGTPSSHDGSADLSAVLGVAEAISPCLTSYKVIVMKSTVPVGTNAKVRAVLEKKATSAFDVASNPEFMKEGAALEDFLKPDRVVIGTTSERAHAVMLELYEPFVRSGKPILFMDPFSAEMTKYAANAMLATKISFMNEIAALCEATGADVEAVRKGIGSDSRIGFQFIYPGLGYGGSCLVGSETVQIRQGKDVRLVRLDRLFSEELGGVDSESPESIALAPEGLEVLALVPGDSRPRFLPVAALTRRGYEGEICHVRTKMGRRVLCTPDHPFVAYDENGGSLGTILAADLRESHWLPVAQTAAQNAEWYQPDFDLLASLEPLGIPSSDVIVRLHEGDISGAPEERLRAVVPAQRFYDVRRSGTMRLDEARSAGFDLRKALLGTCRNGAYVPATFPSDPSFWRVAGLYGSEGWISSDGPRTRISWSFHPRAEMELVDTIASFWTGFGTRADVHPGSTSMNVSVSSRILGAWWLRVLGAGKDSYEKRVPDALWSTSAACKKAYLSGLWHGDGSVSRVQNGRGVVFEYGTVSRSLADGMLRLLGEMGIVASLNVGRPPKSTTDTYFVRISGAAQVEELLDFAKAGRAGEITESISRQTKRIAPTGYHGGVDRTAHVRVVAIDRRSFRGHVYSMEVPGASTFVATHGLVVHNCFPKDVRALTKLGSEAKVPMKMAEAVDAVNQDSRHRFIERILQRVGSKSRVAIWGLSFKPKTDDVREAPALTLIPKLLEKGIEVVAFDPVAVETAKKSLGDLAKKVTFAAGPYEAVEGADALILVTEWNEFRHPDFDRIKKTMKQPVVFDGRNIYEPSRMAALGFEYHAIGRPSVGAKLAAERNSRG